MIRQTLEELLVQSGLVTQAELAAARADAARTRKRLPETLIDLQIVNERRFAEWMAQVSDTPLLDPIPDDVAAVQHKIGRAIGRELEVVPVRLIDDQLQVVLVNPLDAGTADVLQATTGLKIRPMTGVRSEVERLVNRLYPEDTDSPDMTILPSVNFELEHPASTPEADPFKDEDPFKFSNETLLRRPPELDFLRDVPSPPQPADEEFGTMIVKRAPAAKDLDTPAPFPPGQRSNALGDEATAPTNPFVVIERRLDQIVAMMKRMEKRLDDLDAMLAQITNR